ncbi:protein SPIRRIG-like [Phragmites australis]|uniref:protein SPIRRIG-like n=1 Tax=Phragmites australis TaxID=29695 RepID=UPI002D783FB5|nr:protein SPIRRIG-like [Phragmites australis]
MKWSTLLSKVVFAAGQQHEQQQPAPPPPPGSPLRHQQGDPDLATPRLSSASTGGDEGGFDAAAGSSPSAAASPVRGKNDLELDLRRFWEEFRSSSSEKEKERALNLAVDVFCRLVKHHSSVAQLVTKLVEAHVFSFVIGRAFVTDVEKLRIHSKGRSLRVDDVIGFFSDITELGICPGSNLLYAVDVLVTETNDKQPLLDSGILCCLIYILNSLLSPDEYSPNPSLAGREGSKSEKSKDRDPRQSRRLEIEGSVVHIMKALASHPSAAPSLIEDDALQVLFHMVANGSLTVFSQFREGLVPLHTIQLHRHAMQVLGLLLANDNGTSAKYIRKHHLIKVLLMAVKDFNHQSGDAAYTMGIVDLLLECVELSYRPESGSIRLREDIHNAHGYQFLVQFALTLCSLHKSQTLQSSPKLVSEEDGLDPSHRLEQDIFSRDLSPQLYRLLDVLVNLSQVGPSENGGGKSSKSSHVKGMGHNRSRTPSADKFDDVMEINSPKVKDLDAIQMLQDIFLKADNLEVQAEVLNRMFKIFSSHLENYKLCQQLRTVPLFILNMGSFPAALQEVILKILEYAVTVVNCIPEQELLSLCCLLQQPISTSLKHKVLSFFVKLLSFDQQYKKVLREVGVLGVLLDDLKQNKLFFGDEQQNKASGSTERTSNASDFQKTVDDKDAILSPKLVASSSTKIPMFEDDGTISVAWDCLFYLLKRAEPNQQSFRSSNGVNIILPFLVSESHRSGVLRLLLCLIIEDSLQAHPEEIGSLIEILKSGMVSTSSGSQFKLDNDAKCDTFGALWRILGANNSAQRIFGEATGFSLMLTTLHSFQNDSENEEAESSLHAHMKIFGFLLRAMTAAVCNNSVNRIRLHTILSSNTFCDLLSESGLLCVDCEKQVIMLLLELALEITLPPTSNLQVESISSETSEDELGGFLSATSFGLSRLDKERVYNASAVVVLIRSLLIFTPKVQLELLRFIEKLANAGPFNQENLTSVGCVGLLLETISPFLEGSSPILNHALRIVELLGAYRLSSSELRLLMRYILQLKVKRSGHLFVNMMDKLIQMEDVRQGNVSLAPFIEMDMSKSGHASIQVSLGERTWPPVSGYSFVCWFQYQNFFKSQSKEAEKTSKGAYGKRSGQVLRIFSLGAVDDASTLYAELYLHDNGVFTISTGNSSSLSFPVIEMEERKWHHLAVVHSKPNALAGLFQASVASLYLDGKLRHTGKLGYSPSPFGKSLQVTLGTPAIRGKVSDLSWRLRCCYLFEEVLTPGSICFMYILGHGYQGLFQDTDLLRFVPNRACGGEVMAILDSLEVEVPAPSSNQRIDSSMKQGNSRLESSGIVWDTERLRNLSLQLSGRKLIFVFDGTSSDAFRASGTLSLLNLVDPTSAAASPIGGIPRYGRLSGDVYICNQCTIGDTVQTVGGMPVVLALVEAAETRDMLHMALELLALSLQQSHQNVKNMQALRGYHLLALFLHRRMSLFDMQSLDIFFRIAACEASFPEPQKSNINRTASYASGISPEVSFDDLTLPKFGDDVSSVGSHGDLNDFSAQKDSFSHLSELENAELAGETSEFIVLSNADMVEHVLLDWTIWVAAPISVQITLLGFLERMVSMHWFRNHNLTILRRINLVQHLLVTLQRGDVEIPVLEKLVVLLGVILEDGFLASELELVVRFIIMTFDPPELTPNRQIVREAMGKHVIVRNMLLEMLIDLQVTINAEELLEQWHKVVSSRLVTYFLDEAVHPTSMRWITTLLGVCLTSSTTFALKFRASGGFQGLNHMLLSFHDSPEIYYILFCLVFGKPVYPRVPEVRMLDFHALMPSDGNYGELKFVDLLDTIIAMAKATFDSLIMKSMLAHQNSNLSHFNGTLVADLVEATSDMGSDLQGEALMHKTYAARLMGGEAAAPAVVTSVLRFMVDLVKMCPPFSAVCRRHDFLENCVDLYFSCVRSDCALRMAKDLTTAATDEKNIHDDDNRSSKDTFSNLPHDQEQSAKTLSVASFPQEQKSSSSESTGVQNSFENAEVKADDSTNQKLSTKFLNGEANQMFQKAHDQGRISAPSSNGFAESHQLADSPNSVSMNNVGSPVLSERSTHRAGSTPTASPMGPFTPWLGSAGSYSDGRHLTASPSMASSMSGIDLDSSPDLKTNMLGSPAVNTLFPINSKLLLDIDDLGYGGGPCSAGATAVLDFVAQILADIISEQLKATLFIESILESVPLFVDIDSALVFQGLCLSRLMNFLERKLLLDDEEDGKKLDKSRWSVNLDPLCWMIVDRVYMGCFPTPLGVLRTLEFLMSMLQLANKDGRIEDAVPPGKGILSIARGSRQLDPYIHAILKNTNRMIMYCFLPTFLKNMGEDDLLANLAFLTETGRSLASKPYQEDFSVDICTVLQLLIANKRLVLCPSNVDTDLMCCFCINLMALLRDKRLTAQNLAVDLLKYLLVHRRQSLEDLLVCKPNQGQQMDILHGGLDKLLTGRTSMFFEWLQSSQQTISKVLDQCALIMWVQYITGSAKFPGVRIKGMEARRKKEMVRKSRESSKLDARHWEQINERRYNLDLVRDVMSTELRAIRQDKYGWILHGESEWKSQLQQLVHERGIFPMQQLSTEPAWQLCAVEGPYRMRKKLEHSKFKIDTIQNVLISNLGLDDVKMTNKEDGDMLMTSGSDTMSGLNLLTYDTEQKELDAAEFASFKDDDDIFKGGSTMSAPIGWTDDKSSINEQSLYSATEFGAKSSSLSYHMTESHQGKPELSSPRRVPSVKGTEARTSENKSEKELLDNGEYLIRPYLEPSEKIRHQYNCERVAGLDKRDGIFLIGELCLYIIENFYIDDSNCICEKGSEGELSVIDQALGVNKDIMGSGESQQKSPSMWGATAKVFFGGRAWAYNGGAWGKEELCSSSNLPHRWHMWKLDSVHELLKRDYQLRPVAIEIFSMDGCNELLVFHKKEREEVFKNLIAMNLPRNSMLDTTISASSKQDSGEGSRIFKVMAKSFSKRWQSGEITNFQYLMHLNTLAGRGYSDLTQYPVFPWILADYESDTLDLRNPQTFRKLDKPMGCQTEEGEEEFRKRYDSWDDPDVPKFHYGSHYSSAGIVLFYLLRLPPFSTENQKLQGGQFDHADRLFNSVRDTWVSAAGKSNTSDVKELIPEFYYLPEFLENRFNLDLGEKQSGEKVGDVVLPPWAKGSTREFIRKHREALESDYVSENLHRWIDIIFGYKQRGKAAEDAINVFYHYTYEGNVDIDAVSDPTMKASILAQINHFGQTPKQLFQKPHPQRRTDRKIPPHPLRYSAYLTHQEIRKTASSVSQIVTYNDKILIAAANSLLKPVTYSEYISWGFPDRSLRLLTYDQDKLLSTHENLHGGSQIQCTGVSHDGNILTTGGDDGVVAVWRFVKDGNRRLLRMEKALCAHTGKITCVYVSQPYSLIVSGSDDCSVILWDLTSLVFVKQLPKFPASVTALHVNNLTGEILTGAGVLFAVWSINGDCLAVVNTSQFPSDLILSVASTTHSDWQETNWYVTGHQSGAVKVWKMVHCSSDEAANSKSKSPAITFGGLGLNGQAPEYRLLLQKVLKSHKYPVTALCIPPDLKQLLSGDASGHLLSWSLKDDSFKDS